MIKVQFSKDGDVCYVPPAPGDAVESLLEQAAAEFRRSGARMTLRGGVTLEGLRAAQPGAVKVLGITLGGGK